MYVYSNARNRQIVLPSLFWFKERCRVFFVWGSNCLTCFSEKLFFPCSIVIFFVWTGHTWVVVRRDATNCLLKWGSEDSDGTLKDYQSGNWILECKKDRKHTHICVSLFAMCSWRRYAEPWRFLMGSWLWRLETRELTCKQLWPYSCDELSHPVRSGCSDSTHGIRSHSDTTFHWASTPAHYCTTHPADRTGELQLAWSLLVQLSIQQAEC